MTTPGSNAPRWPRVLGAVGMIVAILIVVDTLGDLGTIGWSAEEWRRILPYGSGEIVAGIMPPAAVRLAWALVQLGLGMLLFLGAYRLSQQQQSGVKLCRLWSWLAIAEVSAAMITAAWWLERLARLPVLADLPWRSAANLGIGIAAAVLLSFPAFLLIWLARPEIREQYRGWA